MDYRKMSGVELARRYERTPLDPRGRESIRCELARRDAVVKAAISVYRYRNGDTDDLTVWQVFDRATNDLLAARERAKGGGK